MSICVRMCQTNDYKFDDMTFEERLTKTNAQLKIGKIRCAIEKRGNRLYLVATLPPKPNSAQPNPHRQKIALGSSATIAGLQYAERRAKLLSAQLDNNNFDWSEWIEEKSTKPSVKSANDWLKEFEENIRQTRQIKDGTWKTDYIACFSKLPVSDPLNVDVLIKIILDTEPHSRQRKRFCDHLYALANFAKLEGREKIKELTGKYSSSAVNPKILPSDLLIAQLRNAIDNQPWQWVYGAIATYGLRPHEVFRATWEDYPICRIPENTKTGSRFVLPLYPEWADEWDLKNQMLPNIDLEFSNEKLSGKISKYFYNNKNSWQIKSGGKPQDFTPLYLRHCYARRCFEFCFAPDWSAALMGHSTKVHLSSYRAWIDEKVYLNVYRSVIDRPNRPLPPLVTGD